jgi:NADH:ubiquinone reductase (H+-translocating)
MTFLIVAGGSQTSYYGHDEWQQWAPGLKSVEEAAALRHKILYAFEVAERLPDDPAQRRAWLTFTIIGAGPTGVEMAGAIAEISRQTLKHDFRAINPEDAQIILLDASPRVLISFPEDLAEKAVRSLLKLGVQTKMGTRVHEVTRDGISYQSEGSSQTLSTKTVIWAGGVTATPLAKTLAQRTGAETDHGGKIKVRPDLTIPNFPDIFVVGDMALSLDKQGQPLPGVAQAAMQGGAYAAKAIIRRVEGKPAPVPFSYFDKGNIAVIGRAAAVANAFGVHLWGLPAWLVWAFVHLAYIVEFQSRILVFVQWAIQDVTFNRGSRLITGVAPTDFNFNHAVAGEDHAADRTVKKDQSAVA